MKYITYYGIVALLSSCAALHAADNQLRISNNYGYPLALEILEFGTHKQPRDVEIAPNDEHSFDINSIKQVKLSDGTEVFDYLGEEYKHKHDGQNLDIAITAGYYGYGAWDIQKTWRDPAAEQRELEEPKVKILAGFMEALGRASSDDKWTSWDKEKVDQSRLEGMLASWVDVRTGELDQEGLEQAASFLKDRIKDIQTMTPEKLRITGLKQKQIDDKMQEFQKIIGGDRELRASYLRGFFPKINDVDMQKILDMVAQND